MTLLKRNIMASYTGQIYVMLIGIVLVPMYVRYMGAEAYGLVGYYAMLQAWFMMLDMGLTPTMARETARFRGNAVDPLSLRNLLRALEGIFVGIALLGAVAMVAVSGYMAGSWLKVQQLSLSEVRHSLMLIGFIIALRWVSELYRGVITGFERLVWLSGFNIAFATFRFVLVIPFFIYVGTRPTQFFSYQMAVAVLEVAWLVIKTYRLLPAMDATQKLPWDWRPLLGVLHFSLTIAFASVVWVMATQTDKLILSKFLPLSEYAYFTLAVLVASSVTVISVPISGALIPRMVTLNAEGDETGLIVLYRNATQLMVVIVIPVALVLALFPEQMLWAWTGDAAIARSAAPVLRLYALGNGLMVLDAFPYYLQFAKGDLKLHLIGSAAYLVLLIPALIAATIRYGVIGAGYAWLGANLVFFMFYVPIVHRRFVKGLHKLWLFKDVSGIALATGLCATIARPWVLFPVGRAPVAVLVFSFGVGLLVIAGVSSSLMRGIILDRWRARFC